jgi:hypothetical protein
LKQKASAHIFSHPDCTVGSGISPDLASRLADYTAGREILPTLKTALPRPGGQGFAVSTIIIKFGAEKRKTARVITDI